MKIWDPETPGTLWATPGLLRDSFTFFTYKIYCSIGEKFHTEDVQLMLLCNYEFRVNQGREGRIFLRTQIKLNLLVHPENHMTFRRQRTPTSPCLLAIPAFDRVSWAL